LAHSSKACLNADYLADRRPDIYNPILKKLETE
jgi:hypothetical protein